MSAPSNRVAWIDYSKGICIVAVVCLYTTQYLQDPAQPAGWMQHWVDFARPFRMPDFFLMAGLFLSRTIDRSWREYLDKKVVHFFYFFALWTTGYFALHVLMSDPGELSNPGLEYLSWYVEPFHMLWFIEMLAVFFVVTKLLKPVPWYVVLAGAAALQIISIDTHLGQLTRFCARYVYFYAGYMFAPLFFQFAAWTERQRWAAAALLLTWAVINQLLVQEGVAGAPGVGLLLGFAGACAVIAAGCLLGKSRQMAWLKYLGQNSIVVFLSFYVFVSLAAKVFARFPIIQDISARQLIAVIFGVSGPLLMAWGLRGTPARFLFKRPAWAHLPVFAPRAPTAPRTAAASIHLTIDPETALLPQPTAAPLSLPGAHMIRDVATLQATPEALPRT